MIGWRGSVGYGALAEKQTNRTAQKERKAWPQGSGRTPRLSFLRNVGARESRGSGGSVTNTEGKGES